MVHVYNCHPFDSQQIVAADEEPERVCSGGGALFVLCAGACKLVVYDLQQEGCPQICRFSSVASVRSISYSALGDYLVTIEEKNGSTYLRAYTNWRYQVAEKSRVGVRLLGHFLKGSTFRSIPKEQMEIIEIPLVELPLCMSCCSLTGDLLVGCPDSVVVFRMKQHVWSEQVSVLDFERILILHIQDWSPSQVALCAGYVAIQTDLEVLVVKLTPAQQNTTTDANLDEEAENLKGSERDDLLLFPKHLEILGPDARDCGVTVVPEFTGMDAESHGHISVDYVLYRRFVPDFFQDCRAEETRLHSLQLHPMFTDPGSEEPSCVFAFFSLPNAGYMYSLKTVLELVSTYQYPENAQQAVLCDNFLYVITRNALQCFTVRCSAVAARVDDPYIDTNIKACPPFTMEVCALRIQLFIGLRFLCHSGTRIILLTAADVDSKDDVRRSAFKNIFESSMSRPAHGWNLYVITSVSAMQLYREIVEYSKRYESASPLTQSCVHLLCEAHLLLRTALLLLRGAESAERGQLRAAFQENCAHLGDFFSRFDKDCHLALPYYKMSSLSVTDVIQRNIGPKSNYGKGLLHFLRHSLDEESAEELHKEVANSVLEIFSSVEPSQLPHIVSSPWMQKADPDRAIAHLKQLEVSGPRPASLSLCLASLALRKDDMRSYSQQMDCQPETLQVCGFIEEPKLLLYSRGETVRGTMLARHLRDTQEKLLLAAVMALHHKHKIALEEANLFFMELCMSGEHQSSPQSLVDFWEALLTTTANGSVVQELLFCLTSVYIDRITERNQRPGKAAKSAQDLINSCSHYGLLYPWLRVITPVQFHSDHQDYLQKLQALLCGPTLQVSSILPLMQRISERDEVGLSLHILCATRQGQHQRSISKLLDRCPQALIPYANHELQNDKLYLWWEKMFPELCSRMKTRMDNPVLLSALEETLIVMSKKLTPLKFLDMMPDDGTTAYFLPRLLDCIQKNGHLFGRS